MSNSFVFGVSTITLLLISSISYFLSLFIHHATSAEQLIAAVSSGMMFGLGIAIWAFYFRRQPGTSLWLPRNFAEYLNKRTKNSVESFALGIISVIAEIIFIIAPITAASLAIITLPNPFLQIISIAIYVIVSTLPLFVVIVLIGSGRSISNLQRWREDHKRFLQFASGGSLLILAAFLFVDRVIGVISYGGNLW